jgi:aryl-alcohol dehydrogenase-like predicted oxidoreductase
MMERRRLGKTGLDVSVIGFGGAPIGLLETEQDRVGTILNQLLDEGVNVVDTAAMYRGSEEAIGKAISQRREEYVLVSKCGEAGSDADSPVWSADSLKQTVDRALERLQTDHLDVMLLHTCPLETLQEGNALGALVRARDAGKVRFVGFSGDNEAAAYAAEIPDIAVIETSINICDQANVEVVLPKARDNDVGIIAKRPIANAAWKDVGEQPGFYTEYAETYTRRLERMKVTPQDVGFDGEPADVWPEIALRFTLAQPGVHTAIVGTTNPDHVAGNIQAARRGVLSQDAVEKLRAAFDAARADCEQEWLGET